MNDKKINEIDKEKILKKIFLLLDPENKGFIELNNTEKIPMKIIIILSPIFNDSKDKIYYNEFINKGNNLIDKISFDYKRILLDFSSKI